MMNTVKDVIHSLGGGAGDVAKHIGGTSADVAKRVGGSTVDLAKIVGVGTVDLARRIGPKRGLIGLAIAGVAIGGTIFLVRYLRSRAEEASLEAGEEGEVPGAKPHKTSRAKRKNMHANLQH